MTQPEQIETLIGELHSIRMVLAGALVFIAIIALASFSRAVRLASGYLERDYGDRLTVKMEDLFETAQLEKLEVLCRERLASHPNHAMSLWYLGRVLYLRDDESSALETFGRLRRIHPNWARDHIDPFIAEMTSKGVASRTDH